MTFLEMSNQRNYLLGCLSFNGRVIHQSFQVNLDKESNFDKNLTSNHLQPIFGHN